MIEKTNVCYIIIALEAGSYKYIAASLPSKNRFSILLYSSGLQPKLCSAPMPALCIVPYGVIGPHPDPVRNGAILLLFLGQLLLDPE
jgi:hypothetical protein